MLEGEPFAGPPEAGLGLVGDQHHVVVVGDPANLLDPLPRRHDHADRAEQELGDQPGRLAGGGAFDLEAGLAGAGQVAGPATAELAAILVWQRNLDDAREAGPVGTLAGARGRGGEEGPGG